MSFSSNSLQAAKDALDFYHEGLSVVSEQSVPKDYPAIAREFSLHGLLLGESMRTIEDSSTEVEGYGVEQAVLSGTRMRLADNVDLNSSAAIFNCAEVGVNMLLLHHAAGVGDHVRLMRFNDGSRSDHLALLHFDKGPKKDAELIDPLMDRHGRVKITSQGLLYTPYKVIGEEHALPSYRPSAQQIRIPTTYTHILELAEVLTHIEDMNSPLGFFDYYAAGQVVRKETVRSTKLEFRVETEKHHMYVDATISDHDLDLFTVRRTYIPNGEYKEEHLLHLGFFGGPTQVVYSTDQGIQNRGFSKSKTSMAYVAFGRWCADPKNIDDEQVRNRAFASLQTSLAEKEQTVKQVLREKTRPGTGMVDYSFENEPPETWDNIQRRIHEQRPNTIIDLLDCIPQYEDYQFLRDSLQSGDCLEETGFGSAYARFLEDYVQRGSLVEGSSFLRQGNLVTRPIKLQRPYHKFRSDESAEEFLAWRANGKYELYKGRIERVFALPVVAELEKQYGQAIELRKSLGLL